jgi:hypothetical protein
MSLVVIQCLEELTSLISSVPQIQNKTFSVISEEDLLDKSRVTKLPSAGVYYSGLRSQGKAGDGLGTVAVFQVAVIFESKTVGNKNTQVEALELLEAIRAVIRHTRSPAIHKWRFVNESSGIPLGNVMAYTQQWECPVILTN